LISLNYIWEILIVKGRHKKTAIKILGSGAQGKRFNQLIDNQGLSVTFYKTDLTA